MYHDFYGNNTIGSYITKLPKLISLKGKWKVGLTEISYPKTYFNIETEQSIIISNLNQTKNFLADESIIPGYYGITDLIKKINGIVKNTIDKIQTSYKMYIFIKNPMLKLKKRVSLNTGGLKTTDKISKTENMSLVLSRNLAEVLGFRRYNNSETILIQDVDTESKEIIAPENPDTTAGFTSLYVYCSLVKHKIVGDIQAQLLRVVEIKRKQNQTVISYINPQYTDLITNEFDSIEISIKNDLGNNIKFTSGKSICTLHFKQSL